MGRRGTVLLLAWGFVLMSWIQGPLGSGGFYVTQIDGFAESRACELVAAWTRDIGKSEGRRVTTSECYETAR